MPTPSKLGMSWTLVGWTPLPSGSAIALDNVTGINVDNTGDAQEFSGDLAVFIKMVTVRRQGRKVTINCGDIAKVVSFPYNVPGTLVATLNDPINLAVTGGGALLFTWTNILVLPSPIDAKAGEYADGTLNLQAYAPDGVTDPLTITAV